MAIGKLVSMLFEDVFAFGLVSLTSASLPVDLFFCNLNPD